MPDSPHQVHLSVRTEAPMIYLDIDMPGCEDEALRKWNWVGNIDDFRQLCHVGLVKIFGPYLKPGGAQDMQMDFKRILIEVEKEFA